jgi:hypothetical protein
MMPRHTICSLGMRVRSLISILSSGMLLPSASQGENNGHQSTINLNATSAKGTARPADRHCAIASRRRRAERSRLPDRTAQCVRGGHKRTPQLPPALESMITELEGIPDLFWISAETQPCQRTSCLRGKRGHRIDVTRFPFFLVIRSLTCMKSSTIKKARNVPSTMRIGRPIPKCRHGYALSFWRLMLD